MFASPQVTAGPFHAQPPPTPITWVSLELGEDVHNRARANVPQVRVPVFGKYTGRGAYDGCDQRVTHGQYAPLEPRAARTVDAVRPVPGVEAVVPALARRGGHLHTVRLGSPPL